MPSIASTGVSSFGVVNDVEQQLLKSQNGDFKTNKSSINYKKTSLQKQREDHLKNLQDRIKMAAHGQNGCLKVLKVVTIVAGAVGAAFTGGASLMGAVSATALITTAAIGAAGKIVDGLQQLEEAMKEKKLMLNEAQSKQIMGLIEETKKWIDDEKVHSDDLNQEQSQSLEEFASTLADLEQSFSAMTKVGTKEEL